MDSTKFDGLAKLLGSAGSRREVVKRLAGAALGGGLALGLREASAAPLGRAFSADDCEACEAAGYTCVCHKDESAPGNARIVLCVNDPALRAHRNHGDRVIGADAGEITFEACVGDEVCPAVTCKVKDHLDPCKEFSKTCRCSDQTGKAYGKCQDVCPAIACKVKDYVDPCKAYSDHCKCSDQTGKASGTCVFKKT